MSEAPTTTPSREDTGTPTTKDWAMLVVVCLGFFMIVLENTVVNVALPAIMSSFRASIDVGLWVLNGFLLTYAALLLVGGRLGDRLGQKWVFLAGAVIFTVFSAASGFAPSITWLIVFGVLMGLGGALMAPQTLTVITGVFPANRRGVAIGIWSAVSGLAAVAGPILGGWLVTDFGWEWIFFLNVPIGIVVIGLAAWLVPDLRLGRGSHLDPVGAVLASVGLALIVFGLVEGSRYDWGTVWGIISIPLILALGVVVFGAFLAFEWWQQRRGKIEPLVPFRLFRDRNFSLMSGVGFATSFALAGLLMPFTIYLQTVLGLSALEAGVTTLPMFAMLLVVAPLSGKWGDKHTGRWPMVVGLVTFAIGLAVIALTAKPDSGQWAFVPGLVVAGVGMGVAFSLQTTIAMRDVPKALAGASSGVFNTMLHLGPVLGVAAVGAILQSKLGGALHDAAVENSASLPEPAQAPFTEAFAGGLSDVPNSALHQAPQAPPGVPEQAIDAAKHLVTLTFQEGFTDAMRPSFILPIAIVVIAAAASVGIARLRGGGNDAPRD